MVEVQFRLFTQATRTFPPLLFARSFEERCGARGRVTGGRDSYCLKMTFIDCVTDAWQMQIVAKQPA